MIPPAERGLGRGRRDDPTTKKRDAFDCVPAWERMRHRIGAPPDFSYLLLKSLHQGAVFRDFDGRIFARVLKRDFVDHPAIVSMA